MANCLKREASLVFFFLVLVFVSSTFAATGSKPAPLDISVKFDNSTYSLRAKSGELTYKDTFQTHKIPVSKCTESVVNRIIEGYAHLASKYNFGRPFIRTPYDVQVREAKKEPVHIARGSEFGTWLRELPAKISYYAAEADLLCRKK